MSQFEKTISALKSEIYNAVYMGHSYKDCVPVSILQDAVNQLSDPDRVKVVRCGDCRFWKANNAEEGDTSGTCMNGYSHPAGTTDRNWFCADGEKEE
jgi:hypothetical protein